MTLAKRLRVLFAVLTQSWHERTCPECKARWFQTGKDNGLMKSCADCEAEEFEMFLREMERRHQQGVW